MTLENKDYFQWIQLLHDLPKLSKQNHEQFPIDTDILLCIALHKTIKSSMLTLQKLSAKEIHIFLITSVSCKPSSQNYFHNPKKIQQLICDVFSTR